MSLANSFWVQISIREMNFQYSFPNYGKLNFEEIFTPCKSNTYFQGTLMYVQYGFLCLILSRPSLQCSTSNFICLGAYILGQLGELAVV